jgi:hypothetical protein
MRTLLAVLFCILSCLVAVPDAQAGPLCGLGRAVVRAATAPVRAVGRVRANRREARQSRRAARGC